MSEEIDIAGVKVKAGGSIGKMFMYATAAGAVIGALYGGFEVYKDYMDMKDKIANYTAPDLSGLDKRIELLNKAVRSAEDSVELAKDYTRDIKNDLKQDIDRIERIVDKTEQRVKKSEEDVRELINVADQRFDTKRDQLATDTDRKLRNLQSELNKKLQRALDNPLANK
jgi:chromosome segregation ATPase